MELDTIILPSLVDFTIYMQLLGFLEKKACWRRKITFYYICKLFVYIYLKKTCSKHFKVVSWLFLKGIRLKLSFLVVKCPQDQS